MEGQRQAIEALLEERRVFPPPAEFQARARVSDESVYAEAEADPVGFWMSRALDELTWYREPTQGLDDSNPPFYKWFADGELNASVNCLDRRLAAGGGDKTAYIWVGEPGDERVITYRELHDEVNRLANVLRGFGVVKGDRVAIYLGMVPELPMALLACARIGAAHSVVFGGFSAQSLSGRINDAECKVLITADGGWRKGGIVPLKQAADDAVAECPSIQHVLVVRRTEQEVGWVDGRDHWYHDLVPGADDWCEPERMNAEDMLFLLYTSGTTAKPKGILHTTAGYLLGTKVTHELVFDIRDDDVYWCTADIGWVTGHSYIVYGPLQNHTTGVIYEGAPEHPSWSRHWEIVQRHKVTIYYTAPTAIRALVGAGDAHLEGYDLSSLRLLGTVGEPINRGLDLVPRPCRRRPLPDRRHLVADRDGLDPDRAAARRHSRQARIGDRPPARHRRRDRQRARRHGAARRRRLPRAHAAVALDAADVLRRRRPLRRDLLVALPDPASTSPATGRRPTRMAISGCSAASTT
jgi:acetyl-CoA synthetase